MAPASAQSSLLYAHTVPKVERFRWWLPPRFPGGRDRVSSWRMSAEQAAKHGALRPDLDSRELVDVPDDPGPRPGFQAGWRTGLK